ncbi:MAG: hypothetical protein HKN84_05010 [Gammaproteobacteria bacterium]|nr:hypothetical protein [Gammaproteobacteria bacterium]
MRLPRSVYECLPFAFIAAGSALIGAAVLALSGRWAEGIAGFGLLFIVTGLTLILRRRGYRASRSRLDFNSSR